LFIKSLRDGLSVWIVQSGKYDSFSLNISNSPSVEIIIPPQGGFITKARWKNINITELKIIRQITPGGYDRYPSDTAYLRISSVSYKRKHCCE
jgi:hypothetical protein